MSEVIRVEVWCSQPAMLMVVVSKSAEYEVAYTDDCQTISDWLATGGDYDALPITKLSVQMRFGFVGGAEKFAARFLMTNMTGRGPVSGFQEWEPLYNGRLTIASIPRIPKRFPAALDSLTPPPIPAFNTGVIEGETLDDFRARRAAYRRAKQAATAATAAAESLAGEGKVLIRTEDGAPSLPTVVQVPVRGSTPAGDLVGTLRRVTTQPPRICEIEAPTAAKDQRVVWYLNNTYIGVSNG